MSFASFQSIFFQQIEIKLVYCIGIYNCKINNFSRVISNKWFNSIDIWTQLLSSQGPHIKRQPRFPDIILDICLSYHMVLYPHRNYLNEEMLLKMGKNMLSTYESQLVPIFLVFREKKYGLVLLSNIFPKIKNSLMVWEFSAQNWS